MVSAVTIEAMKYGANRNPQLLKALAVELRSRRAEIGVTQDELASDADVTRTYIGRLELGANQPSIAVFIQLAEGLRVEPEVMFESLMARYRQELRNETRDKRKRAASRA